MLQKLSFPLIKSKSFNPRPIITHGIPYYADSITNPKCWGTLAWREWWEEQIYYIHNGYTTGGVFIPGRYYKFLNFDKVDSVRGGLGVIAPEYVDSHLDYITTVQYIKDEGKNIIVPKARRKALSTLSDSCVMDYGVRFHKNYKIGVVAGHSDYADVLMAKWKILNSYSRPEFRIDHSGGETITIGWKEKNIDDGIVMHKGSQSTITIKTAFHKAGVFKGEALSDIIFEEAGEFEKLIPVINASKDCLMSGERQYGSMFIYGTGGDLQKASKGFKEVWYNADAFNCVKFFFPATKFFFPCYGGAEDPSGKTKEKTPNFKHLKDYQRFGVDDEEEAKRIITTQRDILRKKKDLTEYYEYCQNNPLTVEEVFSSAGSNDFDIDILNRQAHEINSQPLKYNKFKLQYKMRDGKICVPAEVEAIPAKDTDPEHECVMIMNDGHPVPNMHYLDCSGIDSYDKDQSRTSNSLGAMVVLRRMHTIPGRESSYPVALIRNRPPRKEIFYEMCMKLAIYYNLQECVLIDNANGVIFEYFKSNGQERLLAKRPKKFESENSQQMHEYGVSLNGFSKPRMISALQSFFAYHGHKVWFLQLIDEAIKYDEGMRESDCDAVDALGIALMKEQDLAIPVINDADGRNQRAFQIDVWEMSQDGVMVNKSKINGGEILNKKTGEKEDYLSRYARGLGYGDEESFDNDPRSPYSL